MGPLWALLLGRCGPLARTPIELVWPKIYQIGYCYMPIRQLDSNYAESVVSVPESSRHPKTPIKRPLRSPCHLRPGDLGIDGNDTRQSIRSRRALMRRPFKSVCVLLLIIFWAAGLVRSQSNDMGAIQGKVVDEEKAPLPGATVIIASPSMMGTRTAVTDREGKFRFRAIPAGVFSVEVTMKGFASSKKIGVVLHPGMTIAVDMVLGISTIAEEVKVIAEAPLVDVKDASLAKTYITKDILQNIPTDRDVSKIMNLAPGVVGLSTYGGGDITGNSVQIDGLDVADARFGGGAYTMTLDYGVLEEVDVVGLGAPAEYGNFSGGIINVITKSGGNRFSGDAQVYYAGKTWQSHNIDPGDPQWVLLSESPVTRLMDASFHLGGPIIKDKLWFFGGFEYYTTKAEMISTKRTSPTTWPKGFFKLTFQPSERDRFQGYASYNRQDQKRVFFESYVAPEANADTWNKTLVGNLNYLHIFSPSSVFELKIGGHEMKNGEDPSSGNFDLPGHEDLSNGTYTVNWYFRNWWNSAAIQVSTSLSQQANNILGSHDFRFGGEFGWSRGWGGFDYNGGFVYLDDNGQPFMAESNSTRQNVIDTRVSFYAQDDWQIAKSLVVNPGLRLNFYRGRIPDINQTVLRSSGLEPRIGFTWDLFKSHATVLKGHFGRYYEGMKSYYIAAMTPARDDIFYSVPEFGTLVEAYRIPGANNISVDPDIRMPSMDQFVAGLEQVLGKNLSASISLIHRTWKNFIEQVNITGVYEPESIANPITGQMMTVYNQINPGDDFYLITNPKVGRDIGAAYPGIVGMTPYRKYSGLQITLNKRFAQNWQFNVSYLYGHETGNYSDSNAFFVNYGVGQSVLFKDPNYQINGQGRSVISPPHTIKAQATYMFPLGISLSANYVYHGGDTWTRYILVAPLNQGFAFVKAEPLGSQRLPAINNLDLRVSKVLTLKDVQVQVMLDMFNVFNQGVATGVLPFGPFTGRGTSVSAARTFRAGVTLGF